MKEYFTFNVGITEQGFSAVCDVLSIIVAAKPTFEVLKEEIDAAMKFYWNCEKEEGKTIPEYIISYKIIPYVVECETVWNETLYLCRTKTKIPMMGVDGYGYTPDEAQKNLIGTYYEITEALKEDGILAPLCVFKFI